MLTKEEKILYALHGIKSVLNDLGFEDIKNELRLKDGSVETIDCINVLQEFIVDHVNSNQPYKFENLKPNIWVYDNKFKEICWIEFVDRISTGNGLIKIIWGEYLKSHVKEHLKRVEFEENRFYPVTKTMQ